MPEVKVVYVFPGPFIRHMEWIKKVQQLSFSLVSAEDILKEPELRDVYLIQPCPHDIHIELLSKSIKVHDLPGTHPHLSEMALFQHICNKLGWDYPEDLVFEARKADFELPALPRPYGRSVSEWKQHTLSIRKEKGASDEDEHLARVSIASFRNRYVLRDNSPEELWLIRSQTSFFQSVADRCIDQCHSCIVYDDHRILIILPGDDPHSIHEKLTRAYSLLKESSGGGHIFLEGRSGTSGQIGSVLKDILEVFQSQFLESEILPPLSSPAEIYSQHIFLFPFSFEGTLDESKWNDPIMKEVPKVLDKKHYGILKNKIQSYNTRTYLTKEMQRFLSPSDNLKRKKYELPDDAIYRIKIDASKSYELHLDDMEFQYFEDGAYKFGILSFFCSNREKNQSGRGAILDINQYGRRLFLPFLADPFADVEFDDPVRSADFEKEVENASRGKVAPTELHINGAVHPVSSLPEDSILESAFLTEIMRGLRNIKPCIDDRMFILSWYGNDSIGRELNPENDQDAFLHHPWWFEYVFVDTAGQMSVRHKGDQARLIRAATYSRWCGNGLLYGMTRYSHVCLSASWQMLRRRDHLFLIDHMRTLYFELTKLCLFQYALLLQFLELLHPPKEIPPLSIDSVYNRFLDFKRDIAIEIPTVQDQGIEMYHQLRSGLQVDSLEARVQEELQNAFEYERNKKIDRESKQLGYLTILLAVTTTVIIFPTFLVAILDMSIFEDQVRAIWGDNLLGFILSLAVIMFSSLWLGGKWLRRKTSNS